VPLLFSLFFAYFDTHLTTTPNKSIFQREEDKNKKEKSACVSAICFCTIISKKIFPKKTFCYSGAKETRKGKTNNRFGTRFSAKNRRESDENAEKEIFVVRYFTAQDRRHPLTPSSWFFWSTPQNFFPLLCDLSRFRFCGEARIGIKNSAVRRFSMFRKKESCFYF